MNKSNFIAGGAFVAGLVVGGAVGYRLMANKLIDEFEERLAEETERVREYYAITKKVDYPTPAEAVQKLIPEAVESLTALQNDNNRKLTAYHKIKQTDAKAVPEAAKKVEPAIIEENIFASRDKRDDIYVISGDQFTENEDDFTQATWTYYAGDKVVCDDSDERIEDYESILGTDWIESFGKYSDDPRTVHVRNGIIDMEYEIVKSDGSYSREVLGVDTDEDGPPLTARQRMIRGD